MNFRGKIVTVRMTIDEYKRVMEQATKNRLNLSEFIRLRVLAQIDQKNTTEGRKTTCMVKK